MGLSQTRPNKLSTMERVAKFLLVVQLVFSNSSISQSQYCGVQQDETNATTIKFLLMVPYADPLNRSSFAFYYDFQGHQMTPIAYLAVKHINNQSDILKDYTLDFIMSDTGCKAERDIYSFAKDIAHRDKPLAGIVGPSCDSSATSIVQLTSKERLSLVSVHWGRFALFADSTNAFGIIGSISTVADAYIELIQRNNWKRIALLYREADYGLQILFELRKKFSSLPGFEIAFASPIYETFLPLEVIRKSFIRVIFVESTPTLTRKVLCLAYHQGMVFPNYQWVTELLYDSDFYEADFYYDGSRYHCSSGQFYTAVNGLVNFFIRFKPDADNVSTFSGLSYDQYLTEYKAEDELYECSVRFMYNLTAWANPVYDAVWALALALNSSLTELDDNNITFTEESRNKQNKITEIIRRHMLEVDFQGITGRIKFESETGYVNKTIDLYQYNDSGVSKRIAFFRSGELTILQFANPVFIDSNFPHKRLDTIIAVVFIIIEVAALLLAVPAHVINVVYRNYTTIKASSYRLNQFVFVGCYLVIIGAVFYSLSETIKLHTTTQTVLCNIELWTANMGLTLILATVCLKTWRLYYIFKKKDATKINTVLIKDKTLAGIIFLLFLVDILIGVIWSFKDPLKSKEVNTLLENTAYDPGVIVTEIRCESNWTEYWLLTIVSYKGTIMLSSLTFALLTRKVVLKQFETNNVVILVYLLSIISSISVPVYLILNVIKVSITVHFVVISILLDSAVYICLFVLFLPPIIPLFREKYHHYLSSNVLRQEGSQTVCTHD